MNIYESAHGYALFAQGDVANAADELATDLRNPLVLRQFILAQEKLGKSAAADTDFSGDGFRALLVTCQVTVSCLYLCIGIDTKNCKMQKRKVLKLWRRGGDSNPR